MKKIILISGKAESGKNTVAEIMKEILEEKNNRVIIVSFAKHLKQILQDYYGWDGVTKNDYWRRMLQNIGTEVIRDSMNMPNFHVNRICEEIKIIYAEYDFVLIPDCRFLNELYYTYSKFPHETIDVKIVRYNHVSKLTKEQLKHRSECDLDSYNFMHIIKNEGSIKDLRFQILNFLDDINIFI